MGSSTSKPKGDSGRVRRPNTSSVSTAGNGGGVQRPKTTPGPISDQSSQAVSGPGSKSAATSSRFNQSTKPEKVSVTRQQLQPDDRRLLANCLIENIFLITLDNERKDEDFPRCCVLQQDRYEHLKGQTWLDLSCLEEAVFDRLLHTMPADNVIDRQTLGHGKRDSFTAASESRCIRYLCQCMDRHHIASNNTKFEDCTSELEKCRDVIYLNTRTCLQQPDLYPSQVPPKQLIDLCLDHEPYILEEDDVIHKYIQGFLQYLQSDKTKLQETMLPVFAMLHITFSRLTLNRPEIPKCFTILKFFLRNEALSELFLEFIVPKDWDKGICYEQTLLGSMLGMSCIPKTKDMIQLYFKTPLAVTQEAIKQTEASLQQASHTLNNEIFLLLFDLIKQSESYRHKILSWIGKCLNVNKGKLSMLSAHEVNMFTSEFSSDGFCWNLAFLTLKLCEPFSKPCSEKLLKVKPSYTKVKVTTNEEAMKKCVHAKEINEETTLVPHEEGADNQLPEEESYNFITECFFLAHQACHLAFGLVHKFNRLNQTLSRLYKIFKDVEQQYPVQVIALVRMQLEKELSLFLSIKAAVTETNMVEMAFNFNVATATWLSMIACGENTFTSVTLPLPTEIPSILAYIPEFVLSNVTSFVLFLRDFKDEILTSNRDNLQYLMNFILVYMGDSGRLTNPTMRGRLAEVLEALLPQTAPEKMGPSTVTANFYKEELFKEHPLIEHLSEKLLHVFVSIEMTGQSVDTEMKFKFRKSMYSVLEYIWTIEKHQEETKRLSLEAEVNMDAPSPPLFLRFINHMINDATFLLDEALDHMRQLKQLELKKLNGDWKQFTPDQQQIQESNLRQLGMLGQYRNTLATLNIHSLEVITRDSQAIFCHPIMVDRLAGMLNYFLKQLVGPQRGDYKVKDKAEYGFKPEEIVTDITEVYIHLSDQESFCRAVVAEPRSFSIDLLEQAIEVLKMIGKPDDYVTQFSVFCNGIKGIVVEKEEEEESLGEIPEEFQDPIIGTLMKDPVILPASRKTVDRAVISRHLLSDQFDPFNRQPLTMDKLVPDTELKNKISAWIEQQKSVNE